MAKKETATRARLGSAVDPAKRKDGWAAKVIRMLVDAHIAREK